MAQAERFVRERVVPNEQTYLDQLVGTRRLAGMEDPSDPRRAQGRGQGARALEPLSCRTRSTAPGSTIATTRRSPRSPGGASRARGVQLQRARHRQCRGAGQIRVRRAEEAVARAAACWRNSLGIRDDRTGRRIERRDQHAGHLRGRGRRGRAQRSEVVDQWRRRPALRLLHLHGRHRPRTPAVTSAIRWCSCRRTPRA